MSMVVGALMAILVCMAAASAQDGLPEKMGVINGDFEAGAEMPGSGWSWWSRDDAGSVQFDTDARPGSRTVRIEHDSARDFAFSNRGRLRVEPGQQYTATAWAKTADPNQLLELAIVALSGGQTLRWNIGADTTRNSDEWRQLTAITTIPDGCDAIYVRFVGSGTLTAWVDDVVLEEGAHFPEREPKPKVEGWASERIEEALGRGMLARPIEEGNYLGWRLLRDDPADIAFNLYRVSDGGEPVRLNDAPLTQTTDYLDTDAPRDTESAYFVRPVVDGREVEPSEQATVTPGAEPLPYISIPIGEGKTFQKVGIADLNGDGEYDFVIKQPNVNVDPWYRYWRPSETTYTLEAWLSDGTFLWEKDLGWAIESGIWYSPYIVYDFDGDGKAEVAVKTGPPGDPRDTEPAGEYAAGRVRTGPEYLSILDGMTGEEKARVDWPSREGFGVGDSGYNFASRNQLGVAYLDGKTPAIIVARGTYTLMKVDAYHYHQGELELVWSWDSRDEPGLYRGQGAHFMHVADVDGDGRDEIILGASVLDDNGVGLWSLGMGHPDHHYVGNIDPTRPGLEIYYGFETGQLRNGVCLVDAATGEILWGIDERTYHVHAFGLVSDIDPRYPGMECYSGEQGYPEERPHRWLHSAQGELLATQDTLDLGLAPRAAYWDADPQRELIYGGRILDFHTGMTHLEGFVGHQAAWADILGDWREEIIVSVPGELRVYTTTIPARDRRITLMQDPIYRKDVAHVAMGYAHVPMTSFYLAGDLETRTRPPRIILDTDFRSDADDAGALALLNALADNGECQLLGVMASQTGPYVVGAINAVNTYYGRGDVPIGLSPVDDQRFNDYYAPVVGDPANYPSTQSNATAPDSTTLYRRLLHESPDYSVVIVVVGSQTCVHLLLNSPADHEGDGSIGRTGKDLISAKVRELVVMGGNFHNPEHPEHNVNLNIEAAQVVADEWPTPIVYSGWEIGRNVQTGGALTDPERNPVAKAYELYPAGGVGTIGSSSSYDQTAAYYAVRGVTADELTLWNLSERCRVTFPDGLTRVESEPLGKHRRLLHEASDEDVAAVIEALMIQPPR